MLEHGGFQRQMVIEVLCNNHPLIVLRYKILIKNIGLNLFLEL